MHSSIISTKRFSESYKSHKPSSLVIQSTNFHSLPGPQASNREKSEKNFGNGKKRVRNTEEKTNKRTANANERYSKLSSAQLQRRLVANARERSRVHALSNAFNSLRCTIPSYSTEQKLSKLTILRVAINYINALENILEQDPQHGCITTPEFAQYVDECSAVLQTEYGRSKSKHGME